MNEQLTEIFATLGTLLGATSLAWNIWTWHQGRRPRLSIKVKVRETFDGERIFYIIRNRGAQATTIEELLLVDYHIGPFLGFGFPHQEVSVAQCYPESVDLPTVIQPGGVWSGSSPVSAEDYLSPADAWPHDRRELIMQGRLFFKLRCSHFDRPLYGRVRMERDLPFA